MINEMENKLGTLIKEYRKKSGISQRDLANNTKVSCSVISDIENGIIKKPNILLLCRIMKELNVIELEPFNLAGYDDSDSLALNYFLYLNVLSNLDKDIKQKYIKKEKVDIDKAFDDYKKKELDILNYTKLIFHYEHLDLDNLLTPDKINLYKFLDDLDINEKSKRDALEKSIKENVDYELLKREIEKENR